MYEARRFGVRALGSRVHPPGLKVAADGAGGDLAKRPLPREPYLDVIGFLCGEAHIARAERHGAKMQAQALEDLLGALRHPLMFGARLRRRGDRDKLDLPELMLADHAACVAPRGAGLGPEAESPG